jgi:hypothetical protein
LLKSPNWVSAFHNGKSVKSYKKTTSWICLSIMIVATRIVEMRADKPGRFFVNLPLWNNQCLCITDKRLILTQPDLKHETPTTDPDRRPACKHCP